MYQFFRPLETGSWGDSFHGRQFLGWGHFWPRRHVCYGYYRGEPDHELTPTPLMMVANNLDRAAMHLAHDADREYVYHLHSISPTGKMEQGTSAVLRFQIDAAGNIITNWHDGLGSLHVQRRANRNQLRLLWDYWPYGQIAEPMRFELFSNNGTGDIDYDGDAAAVIAYRGPGHYEYDITLPVAGTWRWGITSVYSAGAGIERPVEAAVTIASLSLQNESFTFPMRMSV